MKQTLLSLLLTLPMSMLGIKAFAHNIAVKNNDGVTIYYTYQNDKKELAVSYRGSDRDNFTGEYTGNVVIPKSVTYQGTTYPVTSIGDGAFYKCANVTSVTIPNSVKSIGSNAFEECRKMASIIIPNSVTSIGDGAFVYCVKLTSITIPNFLTSIGNQLFHGCECLTSVIIPNSVTNIGYSAFQNCSGLTSVTIPNSVTTIGFTAFYGCSSLHKVTIPDGVTTIEKSTFKECSSLTSVTIPDGVKSIGNTAFQNCSCLTNVYIPNSVTSIGLSAFSGCSSLLNVYCYALNVPSITSNAFEDSNFKNATLHVRGSSIDNYKVAPWISFKNIVALKYNLTYVIDGEIYKSYEYGDNEIVTIEETPTKEGFTFFGWSEIPTTMPAHDVEVTGHFTINTYKLMYKIGRDVYKSVDVDYGTPIMPEEAPEKDGYTFNGWSWIPSKMPSEDVTITGTYLLKKYKLTYIVDGEEYITTEVEQGSTIVPEEAPQKDGYLFVEWSDLPETMPAQEIIVNAVYNQCLGKCATPTIAFNDSIIKFQSEDENVKFVWSFNVINNSGMSSETDTPTKFVVSVYATKENYEDSDPATMEIEIRYPIGDINGDGKVNAVDLTELIKILLE